MFEDPEVSLIDPDEEAALQAVWKEK